MSQQNLDQASNRAIHASSRALAFCSLTVAGILAYVAGSLLSLPFLCEFLSASFLEGLLSLDLGHTQIVKTIPS